MPPAESCSLALVSNKKTISYVGDGMDYNTGCYLAFGILFIGYLVLEGFDYGVGMLLPFVGETQLERQAILNTLAPVWEGSEVWLIVAGAVLFAAFPVAYSALFSGWYLALMLILTSLILRGVAFEFRDKVSDWRWSAFWDWAVFSGSAFPAFLWGVAISSLLTGLSIDIKGNYVGTVRDLVNPYGIFTGLLFCILFLLHGSNYLLLGVDYSLHRKISVVAATLCKLALFASLIFCGYSYIYLGPGLKLATGVLFLFLVTAVLSTGYYLNCGRQLSSFISSGLAVIFAPGAVFMELYPRIAMSSLDSRWSLDIHSAASNQLTLKIMSITLALVLPAVICIELWKYQVFRHRSTIADIEAEATNRALAKMNRDLKVLIVKAYCMADGLTHVVAAFRRNADCCEESWKNESQKPD